MSALGMAAAALIILLVGSGIGYYLGRLKQSAGAARLEEVETEFEAYRQDVTAHFSKTAEQFHAIGLQYRELYDHLAKGSAALCQLDEPSGEPPFPLVTGSEDDESTRETGGDDEPAGTEAAAVEAADARPADDEVAAESAEASADDAAAATTDETIDGEQKRDAAADAGESVAADSDEPADTDARPDNVVELVRPGGSEAADDGEPESDERTYH